MKREQIVSLIKSAIKEAQYPTLDLHFQSNKERDYFVRRLDKITDDLLLLYQELDTTFEQNTGQPAEKFKSVFGRYIDTVESTTNYMRKYIKKQPVYTPDETNQANGPL
jgi:hypothetical protein